MKRIFAIILAIGIISSLSACGGNGTPASSQTATNDLTSPTTPTQRPSQTTGATPNANDSDAGYSNVDFSNLPQELYWMAGLVRQVSASIDFNYDESKKFYIASGNGEAGGFKDCYFFDVYVETPEKQTLIHSYAVSENFRTVLIFDSVNYEWFECIETAPGTWDIDNIGNGNNNSNNNDNPKKDTANNDFYPSDSGYNIYTNNKGKFHFAYREELAVQEFDNWDASYVVDRDYMFWVQCNTTTKANLQNSSDRESIEYDLAKYVTNMPYLDNFEWAYGNEDYDLNGYSFVRRPFTATFSGVPTTTGMVIYGYANNRFYEIFALVTEEAGSYSQESLDLNLNSIGFDN